MNSIGLNIANNGSSVSAPLLPSISVKTQGQQAYIPSSQNVSVPVYSGPPVVMKSAPQSQVEAQFDFNRELSQLIITIKRSDTGEVIRQIPPKEVISFLEGIMKSVGAVIDGKG
jgi:hypothetical protein